VLPAVATIKGVLRDLYVTQVELLAGTDDDSHREQYGAESEQQSASQQDSRPSHDALDAVSPVIQESQQPSSCEQSYDSSAPLGSAALDSQAAEPQHCTAVYSPQRIAVPRPVTTGSPCLDAPPSPSPIAVVESQQSPVAPETESCTITGSSINSGDSLIDSSQQVASANTASTIVNQAAIIANKANQSSNSDSNDSDDSDDPDDEQSSDACKRDNACSEQEVTASLLLLDVGFSSLPDTQASEYTSTPDSLETTIHYQQQCVTTIHQNREADSPVAITGSPDPSAPSTPVAQQAIVEASASRSPSPTNVGTSPSVVVSDAAALAGAPHSPAPETSPVAVTVAAAAAAAGANAEASHSPDATGAHESVLPTFSSAAFSEDVPPSPSSPASPDSVSRFESQPPTTVADAPLAPSLSPEQMDSSIPLSPSPSPARAQGNAKSHDPYIEAPQQSSFSLKEHDMQCSESESQQEPHTDQSTAQLATRFHEQEQEMSRFITQESQDCNQQDTVRDATGAASPPLEPTTVESPDSPQLHTAAAAAAATTSEPPSYELEHSEIQQPSLATEHDNGPDALAAEYNERNEHQSSSLLAFSPTPPSPSQLHNADFYPKRHVFQESPASPTLIPRAISLYSTFLTATTTRSTTPSPPPASPPPASPPPISNSTRRCTVTVASIERSNSYPARRRSTGSGYLKRKHAATVDTRVDSSSWILPPLPKRFKRWY
jgi:hypothetical protein